MKGLSIVLPCLNEGKNVAEIIKQFCLLLPKKEYPVEIIIVDGGSCSEDIKLIENELKLAEGSSRFFKLCSPSDFGGYGGDILKGLQVSKFQTLAWTHTDLQTDINDPIDIFENFFLKSNQTNILVKGNRKQRNLFDKIFSIMMELTTFFLKHTYLHDINAQPKVFSRNFFNSVDFHNAPSDFNFDLFFLLEARKSNIKIIEYPVYFNRRLFGVSKGGDSFKNKLKLSLKTLKYLIYKRNT